MIFSSALFLLVLQKEINLETFFFKRGSVRRGKKTFSSPQGRRRLHLAGRHISFIFVSFSYTSRPSLDSRAIYS